MILFPAIDILDGRCVRLIQGKFDQKTVYDDDPADVALRFEKQGAEYLHIVDLDGARAGKPVNIDIIKRIVDTVKIPIQVGGGIRSIEAMRKMLAMGVSRVILGSAAVRNPLLIEEACSRFGEQVVVGIDACEGSVKVDGWEADGDIAAKRLAVEMAELGVKRIIYTDISRDGRLAGVNVKETVELASACGLKTIASGGVSSIEDIMKLYDAAARRIEGVIVGKALYEGSVDLTQAIAAVRR